MKEYNINSSFYSKLLQWWDDDYHNYIKAGILLTNQMQFDEGSLESYNIATNARLKQSNFLTWAGI